MGKTKTKQEVNGGAAPEVLPKGNAKPQAKSGAESEAQILMERYDVKEIFRNSRGEFFLQKDLAINSEAGKADKVETFKK